MLKLTFKNKITTIFFRNNPSRLSYFSSTQKQPFNQIMIVRHGQTIWNKQNKWVGWTDIPLSTDGIKQAKQCSKLVTNSGFKFDEVYTSVLTRAIKTANYILDEMDLLYIPFYKHWRLNQKHYGALQGEKKVDINQKYGQQLVSKWRMSFDIPPPSLDTHDNRHPSKDQRYRFINQDFLPTAESLSDIIDRLKPLYDNQIKHKLKEQKKLLVVAHGSSLRALIAIMNPCMNENEVKNFNIPSGIPIIISMNEELRTEKFEYLGDQSEIIYRMEKIKNQTKKNIDIQ